MKRKNSLKWIYKNNRSALGWVFVLSLGNILFGFLGLKSALVIKDIIDFAVAGNYEKAFSSAILFGIIVLSLYILRVLFGNLSERIRVKMEIALRNKFLSTAINKSYGEIKLYHSGELQNRMYSDTTVIINMLINSIPALFELLTSLIGAVIIMVNIDKSFAILFVVAAAVLLCGSVIFKKRIKYYHKQVQSDEEKSRSYIQEVFLNLLAVKVFNDGHGVENKAHSLFTKVKKSRISRATFSVFATSTLAFVFEAGFAYVLIWGAFNIYSGVITYGTMASCLQLVSKIQEPLAGIFAFAPEIFKATASAERIMEIENLNEDFEQKTDCSNFRDSFESIEFKNVTFAYDGENVIENASFVINKDEFTAITGTSGIGKSTCLKLLLGVYKPDSGEIILNTKDGQVDLTKGTKNLFTYVPQGNLIFSGTLRENITFVNENVDEESLDFAVKTACADEFIQSLPDGMDTVIGEGGTGLSEGQIQRIAVARAILNKNPVILLDEATSSLDKKTETALIENLKKIKGITCVTVTHKNAAVSVCDKHYKFKEKKLYEEKCINE